MDRAMRQELKRLVVSRKRMIFCNFGIVSLAAVFAFSFLSAGVQTLGRPSETVAAAAPTIDSEEPLWKKLKTWDPALANELLKKAERSWSVVNLELKAGDREKAIETYLNGANAISTYVDRFGARDLSPGLSFSEVYEQKRNQLNPAVIDSFEDLVSELSVESFDATRLERFANGFSDFLGGSDSPAFKQAFERIDSERARRADNKIRIVLDIEGIDADSEFGSLYLAVVKKTIANAWRAPGKGMRRYDAEARNRVPESSLLEMKSGFELVYGEPFGPLERAATWRIYRLHCAERAATYVSEGGGVRAKGSAVDLPESWVASLELEQAAVEGYQSTWDRVILAEVTNDLADRISGTLESWPKTHRRRLLEDLAKTIEVPGFDLVPNNFDSLENVFEPTGEFNIARLRRYGFRDRSAFQADSAKWLADPNIGNRFEVLLVWIELGYDDCLIESAAILPKLDTTYRARMASALKDRPVLVSQINAARQR